VLVISTGAAEKLRMYDSFAVPVRQNIIHKQAVK
jgi:hypothetical protein